MKADLSKKSADRMARYSEGQLTLAEFVKINGRGNAAKALGCTGPALSKAITQGRDIFVEILPWGSVLATEIARFPGYSKGAKP